MTRYESSEPVPVQVDHEFGLPPERMIDLEGTRASARVHDRPGGNPVVDPLLWRDAQRVLDRHVAAGPEGRCGCCGWQWPCPPRRLAERAELASRYAGAAGGRGDSWRESWTARHDLNGLRGLPGLRPESSRRTNIGLFD